MASTQTWSAWDGSAAGTEHASATNVNLMAITGYDTTGTTYQANPVNSTNNGNSYTQNQSIVFNSTWNSLSALTYKIDNNTPATGLSFVGTTITSGVTPINTASGDGAMSTSGVAANFNTSASPYGTGTSSTTASGKMYGNCYRLQLQTTSAYAGGPGDIATRTITASWTES